MAADAGLSAADILVAEARRAAEPQRQLAQLKTELAAEDAESLANFEPRVAAEPFVRPFAGEEQCLVAVHRAGVAVDFVAFPGILDLPVNALLQLFAPRLAGFHMQIPAGQERGDSFEDRVRARLAEKSKDMIDAGEIDFGV